MTTKAKIAVSVIVLAVGMQFIRPQPNTAAGAPVAGDIASLHPPSTEVKGLLERACYDCHSDHTRYPWYANVQPVGWWLADHVNEGRHELNFSRFGDYPPTRATRKLTKSIDEMESGKMPPRSYRWLHPEARLSAVEIATVSAWARDARNRVNAAALRP